MQSFITIVIVVIGLTIAFSLGVYVGSSDGPGTGGADPAATTASASDDTVGAAQDADTSEAKAASTEPGAEKGGVAANGTASAKGESPAGGGKATGNADTGAEGGNEGTTKAAEAGGEAGAGPSEDDPPPWIRDLVTNLRAGADSTAAGSTAGMVAAAEPADRVAAASPGAATGRPPTYAVQTRRPLPGPEAESLVRRLDRPPFAPRLVAAASSVPDGGKRRYFVRLAGFPDRIQAQQARSRLLRAADVRLSVVRVASPRAVGGSGDANAQ